MELEGSYSHEYEFGIVSGIGIKKTDELYNLHKQACDLLSDYAVTVDKNEKLIFVDGDKIAYQEPASWVLNYMNHSSGAKFNPHITVGLGVLEKTICFSFTANSIALYHLGSYCTCNTLLS